MTAGREHVLRLLPDKGRSQRKAACQSLGGADHIRLNAVMHITVQLSAAAVADLHLIRHEQDILFRRQSGRSLHEFPLQRDHAAFTLNDLHQDAGAGMGIHGFLQGGYVVGFHIKESFGQRGEVLMKCFLTRSSQGSQCTSVEAVDQRDDMEMVLPILLLSVFPGDLDGTLIGLRSGIGEEHLFHPRPGAEFLCQQDVRLGIKQVGGVLHLGQLIRYRLDPYGIGKAEGVHRDAAGKVGIGFARIIPNGGAFTPNQGDGKTGVSIGQVGFVQFHPVHDIPPNGSQT